MKRLPTLAFAALTLFGSNIHAASESENSRIQCEKRYIMLTEGYVRQYIGTTNASLCPKVIYKTIVQYHIFYATLPPQDWGTSFESILTKKSAKKYSRETALGIAMGNSCYPIRVRLFFQYQKCLLSSTEHVQSITDDCLLTLGQTYKPRMCVLKSTFIDDAVSVLKEMIHDKKQELWKKGIPLKCELLGDISVYACDKYGNTVSSLDALPKLDACDFKGPNSIGCLVAVVQLEYAYAIAIALLAKQMAYIYPQDQ